MPHARRSVASAVVWLVAATGPVGGAQAAAWAQAVGESSGLPGSAVLVPDDATYYAASVNNRKQWQLLTESNAWRRASSLPLVRQIAQYAIAQAMDPAGRLDAGGRWLGENERLLALGGELVADEVFVYAGEDLVGLVHLAWEVEQASRPDGRQEATEAESPRQASDRRELELLERNTDLLKVPVVVVGFKIGDRQQARKEIERLEDYLRSVLADSPAGATLEWVRLGEDDFLTMEISGAQVPWRRLLKEHSAVDAGGYEKLLARLEDITAVLSVGLKGDYLLVSLGGSNEHLKRLGQAGALAEREELKPLERYKGGLLTQVSYTSGALRAELATRDGWLERLAERLGGLMPQSEARRQRRQARQSAREEPLLPRRREPAAYGPSLAFALISDEGYESFSYDWSSYPRLPSDKPLELLSHLGGEPLAAMVLHRRERESPERELGQRIERLYWLAERLAAPWLPPATRQEYERWSEFAWPLWADFREATREKLLPALAAGELALVVDARLVGARQQEGAKELHRLPRFEPAVVLTIKDPRAMQEAMAAYGQIASKVVQEIQRNNPEAVPADTEPAALQSRQVEGGTVYWYPLDQATGADDPLALAGGVGARTAALASSPGHAARLLAPSKPRLPAGSDLLDRPLVSAAWVDCERLIDSLRPWVEMYGEQWIEDARPDGAAMAAEQSARRRQTMDQVSLALDIASVVRGITRLVWREGDALVTHRVIRLRDLPPQAR